MCNTNAGRREFRKSMERLRPWKTDPTTAGDGLSYAYHENGDYEQTDEALLKEVVALVRGQEETK